MVVFLFWVREQNGGGGGTPGDPSSDPSYRAVCSMRVICSSAWDALKHKGTKHYHPKNTQHWLEAG